MKNHESEEMYLETMLLLQKKKGFVHQVDIVEELNYAKSSVSRGVNLLIDKGYVTMDHVTSELSFTPEGKAKAEGIYEKHRILTQCLIKMGAEKEEAEENACRIEHVISDSMFETIKKFVKGE